MMENGYSVRKHSLVTIDRLMSDRMDVCRIYLECKGSSDHRSECDSDCVWSKPDQKQSGLYKQLYNEPEHVK